MTPEMNLPNKMIKLNLFLIAILHSFSLIASVQDFDIYAGLGNLTEFPSTVQTNDQGETNSTFTLAPSLHIGIKYDIYGQFSLNPELILTLPEKGRDPLISKFKYFTLFSGAYQYKDFLFRLGVGFALQNISGTGGTQALGNGLNTTDFPMPESSSQSRNFLTLLGVEYYIIKSLSVRTEAYVYNIEEKLNRAYTYNLSVLYHFGDLNLFATNSKKEKRRKKRSLKRIKKPSKNKR
jgi:hypothetical protein